MPALLVLAAMSPAAAQPGSVGDGERVEITAVANPHDLTRGEAFDLHATLRNHQSSPATVALFVTLHERGGGDPCSAGSSHWEVTHQPGEAVYIHRTVKVAGGATVRVPGPGQSWTGVVDEVNNAPDGDYHLCYWVEASGKTRQTSDGVEARGPWMLDRQATPVQVSGQAGGVAIGDIKLGTGLVAGLAAPLAATVHNPAAASAEVVLRVHLHGAGPNACQTEPFQRDLARAVELRVPGGGSAPAGAGDPWLLTLGSIPEGEYVVCIQATPADTGVGPGDVRGVNRHVRASNHPPVALVHIQPSSWQPGTQLRFHAAAADADHDPVWIAWDLAGLAATTGSDASVTFEHLDTYLVNLTLDDGYQQVHLTCLVPVPGNAATVHGCPTEVPEAGGFHIRDVPIPLMPCLAALVQALLFARRRPPVDDR